MPVVSSLQGQVQITGASQAQSQLQGVHKATQDAGGGIKGMLANMLSFGGAISITNLAGSAFNFLKDTIGSVFQESMDAAAGMAQTVTVLNSTHNASGMTAQAVADLAGNLSHLTMFSDDTIQSAENMLLTFTNIGHNVFPQATKTVLDMSQALGQDTKSSAIQLGKALNDPIQGITALQRVGVTFTQSQKDAIKAMMDTGDKAGAQKLILAELNKEFGNSATSAGKTFPGQLKILGQSFADVKQTIGDAMMPMLQTLVGFVRDKVVPAIQGFVAFLASPGFKQFATVVGGVIVAAIQGLITAIGKMIEIGVNVVNFFKNNEIAMDGLKAALLAIAYIAIPLIIAAMVSWALAMIPVVLETLAIAAPYILVGLIVAAVIFGIIMVVRHWGDIMNWIKGVFTAVVTWIGDRISWVGDRIKEIVGNIGGAFHALGGIVNDVWNGIVGAIRGAINSVIGVINGFLSGLNAIHIDIGTVHIGVNIPLIPYLASGIENFVGGLAYVHAGEVLTYLPPGTNVTPANQVSGMGGGGPMTIIVQPNDIYLDGQKLASGLLPHTVAAIRYQLGTRF